MIMKNIPLQFSFLPNKPMNGFSGIFTAQAGMPKATQYLQEHLKELIPRIVEGEKIALGDTDYYINVDMEQWSQNLTTLRKAGIITKKQLNDHLSANKHSRNYFEAGM